MPSTDDLRTSIRAQLDELDAEIPTLRAALQALDGRPPAHAAPASTRRRRRRARKDPPAQPTRLAPTGKLLKILSDHHDGLSASALAKEANAELEQVNTLLREMEGESRVKRTGQRRGTRWHVAG
jgi:hypothetical protein